MPPTAKGKAALKAAGWDILAPTLLGLGCGNAALRAPSPYLLAATPRNGLFALPTL